MAGVGLRVSDFFSQKIQILNIFFLGGGGGGGRGVQGGWWGW